MAKNIWTEGSTYAIADGDPIPSILTPKWRHTSVGGTGGCTLSGNGCLVIVFEGITVAAGRLWDGFTRTKKVADVRALVPTMKAAAIMKRVLNCILDEVGRLV
ncbi:MAG: hypothetical protein Q9202_001914 [Teloschistes flavicans]